ncbi:hypothetical protein EVG20_g3510 [Dentipellis fragilis]|uniref:Senescence domain-containing protein n=1 Tax=Dentipellis fragilis TaxID=205917 RepID=A0A4Y9Z141_9AGAM|nr:hypothetical protein EVG20_g3510 [Dentipellis fragilis]
MSFDPQAFVLLTLPDATLTTPSSTFHGDLVVEYVTVTTPASAPDVFLVFKLGAFETVLDPRRTITASVTPRGEHKYVFHSTRDDPSELFLSLPAQEKAKADDVETFHGMLTEYGDFRGDFAAVAMGADRKAPQSESAVSIEEGEEEDLRGRFVLMNEDNGEVIGALDNKVKVHEDPALSEKGREKDPVVVELSEEADGLEGLSEEEVLVRAVPPEDRDWILNSAVFISRVIAGGTTVLETAMSSASNFYIAHSTPDPSANANANANSPAPSSSGTNSKGTSPAPPSQQPSRMFLLMQSPKTREHLGRVHAVSGHAVNLSNKTAALVEGMIQRVVGAGPDKGKAKASAPVSTLGSGAQTPSSDTSTSLKPPLPPRSRPTSPGLPGYSETPPLPPRRTPVSSRSASPQPPVEAKAKGAADGKPKPHSPAPDAAHAPPHRALRGPAALLALHVRRPPRQLGWHRAFGRRHAQVRDRSGRECEDGGWDGEECRFGVCRYEGDWEEGDCEACGEGVCAGQD